MGQTVGLIISPGITEGGEACAVLPLIDDDALEFDHSFTLELASVSEPSGVTQVPGTFSSTEVTISDDEGNVDHWLFLNVSVMTALNPTV